MVCGNAIPGLLIAFGQEALWEFQRLCFKAEYDNTTYECYCISEHKWVSLPKLWIHVGADQDSKYLG